MNPTDSASGKPLSKRRVQLFKVTGLLLPFCAILLLELLLRLFHYGYDQRLFITATENDQYYVMNPDASRRYFSTQEIATTGNHELFKKEKDANTCRIFVLGESTTIGYPYFHNGSFHRWLQYRLSRTYPNKNFEIINVALTAVNSYTVLGFAKEVVHYSPDAVLIYSGHNEYYGSLGVGSTEKIAGSPWLIHLVLALRQFRVVQLLTNGYEGLGNVFRSRKASAGKARMELMVADQQIPYGSVLYKRGLEQFRANMDATLQVFDQAKVPVFLSTLVSNEKDLPPFISLPVDSAQYPGFESHYVSGVHALQLGDSAAAWANLRIANQVYGSHAGCNYYLGLLSLQNHDTLIARGFFSKASDLDALRFRAPGALNTEIAALCHRHKQASLVDAFAVFEKAAPSGVIGNELVLEHVHPNIDGYALLSDVFYKALQTQGVLPPPQEKEMSFTQLRSEMPFVVVDSLAGAYKIANLKKSWPFNRGNNNDYTKNNSPVNDTIGKLATGLASRQITWDDAMTQLYDLYIGKGDLRNAARVTEGLVLEHPLDVAYAEKAANLSGQLGDLSLAAFYFRQAFNLSPSFDKARNIFVIYLKQDEPMKAMPYLDYAMAHNTQGMDLTPVKHFATAVIQLQLAAQKTPRDAGILKQIASKYYEMGNRDGAMKYLELALKAQPGDADTQHLLLQLKKA